MPTANKFAWILEATAKDVSGFASWTTLGGFNKDSTGSPTQAQIDTSLINAAKLYFNFYQLAGTIGGNSVTLNVSGVSRAEPQLRAKQDYLYKASGGLAFYIQTIERFYNGATTNESNFVGYGSKVSTASNAFYLLASESIYQRVDANVELTCATDKTDIDLSYQQRKVAYAQVLGIHFVCICNAYSQGSALGSYTVDTANQSASATNSEYGDEASASIDNFTFYTY